MNLNKNTNSDLVIIGGGITGLTAAYIAAKQGLKVTLVEADKKFGGLLNTFEVGGTQLEIYYHHFFTHDAELNWLIKELNIQDKLFYQKTTMGVFRQNKIYNFNSPFDLLKFKPINFLDKCRFVLTSLYLGKFAKWEKYENISCLEWFNKWAGKSTTQSLWQPLLNIKFGPFANQVPLSWMIGRLKQRINSRKNGDEKLGYIDGSLAILLNAILNKLKEFNVELINNSPIKKINLINGEINSIETSTQIISGKDYLFTIPTINLANLLKDNSPNLSESLIKIEYFGAVCVVLELKKSLSKVYWLNVADEGFPFGGIIEHTNFISPKKYNGNHIVYLSRYFAKTETIAAMSQAEIEELMLKYLPKIYPEFRSEWINKIHVFKTNSAATVCDLNFSNKVPNCKTEISNLFIASMCHVYPDERSTNNSIRIALEACKTMNIKTSNIPNNNTLSGKIGF